MSNSKKDKLYKFSERVPSCLNRRIKTFKEKYRFNYLSEKEVIALNNQNEKGLTIAQSRNSKLS